jgi:hypothetical protein
MEDAKKMLDAFYEFVQITLKNGDSVSCQPLGLFTFKTIKSHHYSGYIYDKRCEGMKHIEGISASYSKPIFKVGALFAKDIKYMTTNKPFDLTNIIDKEEDNDGA